MRWSCFLFFRTRKATRAPTDRFISFRSDGFLSIKITAAAYNNNIIGRTELDDDFHHAAAAVLRNLSLIVDVIAAATTRVSLRFFKLSFIYLFYFCSLFPPRLHSLKSER